MKVWEIRFTYTVHVKLVVHSYMYLLEDMWSVQGVVQEGKI